MTRDQKQMAAMVLVGLPGFVIMIAGRYWLLLGLLVGSATLVWVGMSTWERWGERLRQWRFNRAGRRARPHR